MTQQDAKHVEFGVSLTFLEVAENFLSHGLLHSKKYFFLCLHGSIYVSIHI